MSHSNTASRPNIFQNQFTQESSAGYGWNHKGHSGCPWADNNKLQGILSNISLLTEVQLALIRFTRDMADRILFISRHRYSILTCHAQLSDVLPRIRQE